jgi:hypothetical protein
MHLLLVAGSGIVLMGSPNHAKADPYRFQTLSRNIFCQIDYRGLSCDLIAIPGPTGDLKCQQPDCNELRFFLPQVGKAFSLPRSDSMAYLGANTISAGTRLKASSIACSIFKDRLSCDNLSGGSLVLKRVGYELNLKPHR